jgi:hypothetical protein
LDFGTQLTNNTFSKTLVLENKGKRPQALRWINETITEINLERQAESKAKSGPGKKEAVLAEPGFSVFPEEVTLRPRTATMFTFKGSAVTPEQLKEVFVLESKVSIISLSLVLLCFPLASFILSPVFFSFLFLLFSSLSSYFSLSLSLSFSHHSFL